MINIRQATIDDAVAMAYIMRSLSHFYLDEGVTEIPQWLLDGSSVSQFEQRLVSEEFTSFVYIHPGQKPHTGEIAGFISLKHFTNRLHLQSLFVAEAEQGRGVARALWRHVQAQFPAKHYTVRSSLYAVPVYRAFGFVEEGEVQENRGACYQAMALHPL